MAAKTDAENEVATDDGTAAGSAGDSMKSGDSPDSVEVAEQSESRRGERSVSLSVRSLLVAAVMVVLIAAIAALGWLYLGARHELDVQAAQSANDSRAEKMTLGYAVSAATMDYKDLQAWKVKLVAGTSPELNKRLTEAGTSMEQVLTPLQWSSSARPLVAKVRTNTDGVYVVDSFVSVTTKTIQSPDPLQSTATYSMTIDSNNGWQIIDVGGIASALEGN